VILSCVAKASDKKSKKMQTKSIVMLVNELIRPVRIAISIIIKLVE
jgi:hypothetical protein